VPHLPTPKLQFPGATHEILVAAINPDGGSLTVDAVHALWAANRPIPYLLPINGADQFEATDDEMVELTSKLAWGVCVGALDPERGGWLESEIKTLAHIRGEVHAP
jgi:hypothetical protein